VTGNVTGLPATGGATISSYGDNDIDGNGDAPEVGPVVIAKK